ncbi:MAG: hypothetical protein M1825_004564 [Sarcosagium campestre]|nr:MAG: hypothetical protein M1825_004564 [Sarcosagium campestre]
MTKDDSGSWDKLEWRRRLETFGQDDSPVLAIGPTGQLDAICNLGELTDQGRASTLSLGKRLRHLYVDQLGFMPAVLTNADIMYLRATPMPRALESVQQSFWGMYPLTGRTAAFPAPTIVTRTPSDETLYPNDGNCRRFSQLSNAFAQRTADRWNKSDELAYLDNLLSKWMPPGQHVAVDSHPRLSGIMDTINSTLAHGPATRLPSEFYDPKGREIIDRIGVEEWFSGYNESREYRSLGIGALMGDLVSRMVGSVEGNGNDGLIEVGGEDEKPGKGRGGETSIKFAMSGCHDTTLAAIMSSLGAFKGEKWPPYTSHVALELFRAKETPAYRPGYVPEANERRREAQQKGLFDSLFGGLFRSEKPKEDQAVGRRPLVDLDKDEKAKLDGYYVRVRFNDRPKVIEGCKAAGKHLDGDESFCTLAAFKEIVDKYTPSNWRRACGANLDQPAFPTTDEHSGV